MSDSDLLNWLSSQSEFEFYRLPNGIKYRLPAEHDYPFKDDPSVREAITQEMAEIGWIGV